MVLSRLQGAWEPSTLTCLASPGAWAQLTASSPCDSGQQLPHSPQFFLDLEKAFELASPHAILATLARKGTRGKTARLARGLTPAPSGQSQVPGPQITLQGTGRTGRPRAASSARSC
ncbi:hypothetical protein GWK47_014303 [Chionoecetes opilio]|uniref:Uncharacterized protein n=1 Tax=Chionoecetes opilio TaxID=41210 RepID=A0A8J5CIW8_CHIOP|nr:hypothetical protein GWK47_014303 [Chionoecetes opilio]